VKTLLKRGWDMLFRSPPGVRRPAAMAVDAAIVVVSFALALFFRFDGSVPPGFWRTFWPFAVLSAAVFVALLHAGGIYRNVMRYTGIYQSVQLAGAASVAVGVLLMVNLVADMFWSRPVPVSVVLIGGLLAYVQLVAVRLYPRFFYEFSLREVGQRHRALIVGAGDAGVALARQLWRMPEMEIRVVGFVDEDPKLLGRQIEGVPVLGGAERLEEIIRQQAADRVLIALPGAPPEKIDRIWRECMKTGAGVKVVPRLAEFLKGETVPLRELRIQDLLGREQVEIDLDALTGFVNGKRVLVTGAGGSIGRELCRQLARLGPAQLALLDRDESALYYLEQDLQREGFAASRPVIGDVTAAGRMRELCASFKPHLVFHAAAYKHVPLMELHPDDAVINNVEGSLIAARAAGECGAEKFINVSTDKAVRPANVMGLTKRVSEMVVQAVSREYPKTVYATVRFGNVLGSRGSVVPTFQRQIEAGGPVTVTHPEMTRYFMTIPEAVSLILQAGAMADSYATYVLEMGRPVKIVDLARKIMELMRAPNVEVRFVGLRPGEKLHEELYEENERPARTGHPMIFRLTSEDELPPGVLGRVEELILHARARGPEGTVELMHALIPGRSGETRDGSGTAA
jgi:FlaA1/EpsC-like NDP-sugar epimerase